MKLREIADQLTTHLPGLRKFEVTQKDGGVVIVAPNQTFLILAFGAIAQLPLGDLAALAKDLADRFLQTVENQNGQLSQRDYDGFLRALDRLRLGAEGTLSALRAALPPAPSDRISVKLPNVESMEDVRSVLQKLQVIFDQPLLRINEEPLLVVGVDVGSTWIELAARSAGGMAAAAALVRLLLEGFKVIGEYRKGIAVSRRYELETEIRRREADLILSVTEGVVMKIAQQWVENPTGATPARPAEPELVPVVVNAMKELLGLLQKGAVVTYTLGAGEARASESTANLPAGVLETQLGSGGTPPASTNPPQT